MEFTIVPKSVDTLPEGFHKVKWTVEDCSEYIAKRASSQRNEMKPLHEVLKGAQFDISEPVKEPSEEYRKRIEELKIRASQREYERMTSNLHKKDTSLHFKQELKNPMDNVSNAVGALAGAATVGVFFYYCTRNILKPHLSISLSIICFALMLVLEALLIMARFYLSDHPDPMLKINKSK